MEWWYIYTIGGCVKNNENLLYVIIGKNLICITKAKENCGTVCRVSYLWKNKGGIKCLCVCV